MMQIDQTSKPPGMFHGAPARSFQYARRNREAPTPAEYLIWEALKDRRLGGYKFRRQHPAGGYVLDFYCHAARLAVEIDGGYHLLEAQQEYDENRTKDLHQMGICEIRFTNEAVFDDYWGVLESIWQAIEAGLSVR